MDHQYLISQLNKFAEFSPKNPATSREMSIFINNVIRVLSDSTVNDSDYFNLKQNIDKMLSILDKKNDNSGENDIKKYINNISEIINKYVRI